MSRIASNETAQVYNTLQNEIDWMRCSLQDSIKMMEKMVALLNACKGSTIIFTSSSDWVEPGAEKAGRTASEQAGYLTRRIATCKRSIAREVDNE